MCKHVNDLAYFYAPHNTGSAYARQCVDCERLQVPIYKQGTQSLLCWRTLTNWDRRRKPRFGLVVEAHLAFARSNPTLPDNKAILANLSE